MGPLSASAADPATTPVTAPTLDERIGGSADALMFIMAIPNLVGICLRMTVMKRELAGYEARLRYGEIRRTAAVAQPAG